MDANLIDGTPLEAYWGSTKLAEIWFNGSMIWPAKVVTDSYLQLAFFPSATTVSNIPAASNIVAHAGTKVHITAPQPHSSNYDADDICFVLRMSADGQTWTDNVSEIASNYGGGGFAVSLDGTDLGPVPFVTPRGCDLTIDAAAPVGTRFVITKGLFGSATGPASGTAQICGIFTIIA